MYEFLRTMPIALLTGCDQWANVDFLMQIRQSFLFIQDGRRGETEEENKFL